MQRPAWLADLFSAIDHKDPSAFVSFLTDDATFRYGSQPEVSGRAAVEDYVGGFFSTVESLSHNLLGFWSADEGKTLFAQGKVTYTLKDGRQVSVPFLNLFEMSAEKIRRYQVYIDPTPMA